MALNIEALTTFEYTTLQIASGRKMLMLAYLMCMPSGIYLMTCPQIKHSQRLVTRLTLPVSGRLLLFILTRASWRPARSKGLLEKP
jgi:hypothetical protein